MLPDAAYNPYNITANACQPCVPDSLDIECFLNEKSLVCFTYHGCLTMVMCIILVCAPILRPLCTFYRLPILTIVHFAVLLPFSCAPSAPSANLRAIVGLYRPQSALVVIICPCSTITSHLISRTTSNHSPLHSTVVDQPSSSLPWPAIRPFVNLSVHQPCDPSSIRAFEPLSLRPFPLYYTVWFDLALVHFVPFALCQSA